MRWTEHVARKAAMKNAYTISAGKPEGTRSLEDLRIDDEIILKWI
jgi:hypothetical protein